MMNPDVLVKITGTQNYGGMPEDEPIEVLSIGNYTYEEGVHRIEYDEAFDETTDLVHNTINISDNEVVINKNGAYDVELIFQKDKTSLSYYALPFGQVQMNVATRDIDLEVEDSRIRADIYYTLSMNGEHMADCHVNMDITNR